MLDQFGFGQTQSDSEYYFNLMNDNATLYETYASTAAIQMNYRGLGLPNLLYKEFANLLSIASHGEVNCVNNVGGFCILPQVCSAYTVMGLWDYDFKIKFSTSSSYIRVPLATFAADYEGHNGLCAILVEYLDDRVNDSKQILLGGMFLQSFYLRVSQTAAATNLNLFINKNALPSTYLGNAVLPQGNSPFDVTVKKVQTDSNSEKNGLPTFTAAITGTSVTSAYYYMDFTADHTVVWQNNCTQTGIGKFPSGSCALEPTLMDTYFNPANNPDGLIRESGVFSDIQIGGYVVSGAKYDTTACLSNACKFVQVWSVDTVSADGWLYDENGAAGIIGMGPNSHLWNGYADASTDTVTYSIALARVGFGSSPNIKSNITLGGAGDSEYTQNTNMQVTADSNYMYELSEFGFGIVYQTNGQDSSEYFQNFTTQYPVIFTTNFVGLGLPADLYENVTSYLELISHDEVVCSPTLDGICKMPKACAEYANFESYTFKLQFASSANGNYIRVPLGTFAQDVMVSGGAK